MQGEIWQWSACDIASAIQACRISSFEAVTSCLARLDQINPRINAVVDVLREESLAAANAADRALSRGQRIGPLHGVPVTIKINVDCAGRPTTNGVVAFKDRIAPADSPAVANWRRAGAVIIGRTNVPAFSARFFTDNALYGRTLNPWDSSITPGGSSGGAAAAVASGIGPLAHGNDRAGSVRYPAYACGVVGLRPTFGRVPTFEPSGPAEISLTTQLTHVQGVLARSIRDLRLGFAAMTAGDARDPWWVPVGSETDRSLPRRVALFAFMPGIETDAAVSAALRTAAAALADAGYQIEEAAPPCYEEAARLFFTLIRTEERATTTKAIETLGDDALRRARASTMAYAEELDLAGYVMAFARRASILREWLLFLERYPLLLMPVSWQRPFPQDYDQRGDAAVADMLKAHEPMLAISVLGLPGLAVPTGLVEGVPVGVQLVAARFSEEVCLAAGEAIESQCSLGTPIDPRW